MRHRACGGAIQDDPTGYVYRYCGYHEACDPYSCPKAEAIPAIVCVKCGMEILGDSMIQGDTLVEEAYLGFRA